MTAQFSSQGERLLMWDWGEGGRALERGQLISEVSHLCNCKSFQTHTWIRSSVIFIGKKKRTKQPIIFCMITCDCILSRSVFSKLHIHPPRDYWSVFYTTGNTVGHPTYSHHAFESKNVSDIVFPSYSTKKKAGKLVFLTDWSLRPRNVSIKCIFAASGRWAYPCGAN